MVIAVTDSLDSLMEDGVVADSSKLAGDLEDGSGCGASMRWPVGKSMLSGPDLTPIFFRQ